tara:strand:- start:1838 stop:2218 length:381 start_codon:yes stop_codon:yes gene_type:complete
MENYQKLFTDLPLELANKILFEFKGMQHPVANIISEYWFDLDSQYSIYLNIQLIKERKHIDNEDESFTITMKETYKEIWQDYPRMYFPVEYDFIETIIYELYVDDDYSVDEIFEENVIPEQQQIIA